MNKNSRSGTDLISLLILFFLLLFFLLGQLSSKKPKAQSFQSELGWKLAGLFFELIHTDWHDQIFNLMSHFQDGGHDVILRGKVLPLGECMHSICPTHMFSSICQYLIHSTFIRVSVSFNCPICPQLPHVRRLGELLEQEKFNAGRPSCYPTKDWL